MGFARWSPDDWSAYAARAATRTRDELFGSRTLDPSLDPRGAMLREARDSDKNPNATGIIIGLDVTGSMGMIADSLARRGLGTLVAEVLRRRPVPDPQVMVMGIGDAGCDRAPLQVTQFEADIRIAEQLKLIWLEHGGGGNDSESYQLPWYFAARHVAMDCMEKRGKKGYLFTVGDEMPPPALTQAEIIRIFGEGAQGALDPRSLLKEVQRSFHVFHMVVEEGSFARRNPDAVVSRWRDLLGQNVLRLSDHTKLAEVIVSAIEMTEGADCDRIAASWGDSTALVVRHALGAIGLPSHRGLIRFGRRA